MCDHCGCGDSTGHDKNDQFNQRTVQIEQEVLAHERAHAEHLRQRLAGLNARMINVIGSPGCGKTELICALIKALQRKEVTCAVIEGDLATDNDAQKIRATGAPAHQVTTGTACHLTAHDVEHGLTHLAVSPGSLIIVENVGNLVCPTLFDLGETLRLVCLSVTEGTDKPQKYPISFERADLVAITKCDLLPHVEFDVDRSLRMIDDIKPGIPCVTTAARGAEGVTGLVDHVSALWTTS